LLFITDYGINSSLMSERTKVTVPESDLLDHVGILPECGHDSIRNLDTSASGECETPGVDIRLPETLATLQATLRKQELARHAFRSGEEARENSPYEDNGGGIRTYHERLTQPQERSINTLLRTHHTLAGDDIKRGIEQYGLYELLHTGIDGMKLDDRRLLARHLEPLREVLRYRPDAINRNGGDNLIIADIYGGASPEELLAYADDLVTFRNILLTSGLSKRFQEIRQTLNPNTHVRKQWVDKDLRTNGPIQVIFERQAGRSQPRVVRASELKSASH
jgi:hypothetical protein